jgi:hypothetical protein
MVQEVLDIDDARSSETDSPQEAQGVRLESPNFVLDLQGRCINARTVVEFPYPV